jgi:hypothetical protein
MPKLDASWMPNCAMKRVICHWTAGSYKASSLDREHYHILIESDGKLIRGNRSIADNVSTADGVYAAHTLGCNTGSIGVAVCCMSGSSARPFSGGACPMTPVQWETMCEIVADLCRFYRIPVTPQTVLGHGEVEVMLGIQQRGKWDPMVLPWNTGLSRTEVGTFLRASVRNHLEGPAAAEELMLVTVNLGGKSIGKAPLTDGAVHATPKAVAEALGWTATRKGEQVRFAGAGSPTEMVPLKSIDGKAWIDVEQFARMMGRKVAWDTKSRVLAIT